MDILAKIGGRKFVLAIFAILGLFGLAIGNPESITTELITALIGILGVFNTANSWVTTKAPQSTALPTYDEVKVDNMYAENLVAAHRQEMDEWKQVVENTFREYGNVLQAMAATKSKGPDLTRDEILNTLNQSGGLNNVQTQASKNRQVLGQFP